MVQISFTETIRGGLMGRGDEFRKAYGGLLEAKSMQDYREAYTSNSKAKRIMDNYKAKMDMFTKYANYTAKYPKNLISIKDGIYYVDFGDGTGEKKISKTVYDQYDKENIEIEENATRYAKGIKGYDNLFKYAGVTSSKDKTSPKDTITENKDGDLTLNGKTVDEITNKAEEDATNEIIKEEAKNIKSGSLKTVSQGMVLDKNNMIGNAVKIKNTDQYYNLDTGKKISEGEALRNTPEGKMVMEQHNAMQSLPETPTLASLPGNYGMSLGSTDTIENMPGWDKLSNKDKQDLIRLRNEGVNEYSSIEDKLNYERYGLDQYSPQFDSTAKTINDPNQVSPFGRARALALSKKATELGLEGRGLRKFQDTNTKKVSLVDPQMGISVTPTGSGGMTVGTMTGMPTGLQEMKGGTLTNNRKSGTVGSKEMREGVDRLVDHYAKYGNPYEKTGYYAHGVNELTGSTPEDRIASHKMLSGYKKALLGWGSGLARDTKTVNKFLKSKLPSGSDQGYANPYFPK